MNTRTKLTALLMSVLMIVAMFPAFALNVVADTTASTDVAEVYDSTGALVGKFDTLKQAWDKAVELDNCTVKLLANANAEHDSFLRADGESRFENRGMILPFGKTLTLDLNGYVVTPPTEKVDGTDATGKSRIFWIFRYASMTVIDSNPTAVHKFTKDDTTGLYTWDEENGTIELAGGVITGGRAGTGTLHAQAGGAFFVQGGSLTIEGGNIVGNDGKGGHGGGAITLLNCDTTDLPDEFKKDGVTTIHPALTISGGTFVGNTATYGNGLDIASRSEIPAASDATNDVWATSSITGGTFSTNMSGVIGSVPHIMPATYKVVDNEDGTFGVVADVAAVAEVYDSTGALVGSFATFGEAWDKAVELDNCTVKLLANANAKHDSFLRDNGSYFENRGMILPFGKTLTLDLNGYVVTPPTETVAGEDATGKSRIFWIFRYASMTVIDSNPTAVHKFTKDDTTGLYTWDEENGTIELAGGVITGGRAGTGTLHAHAGGAFFVQGGSLTIEGGNIVGNDGNGGHGGGAITLLNCDTTDLPDEFKKDGITTIHPALTVSGGTFVGNTATYGNGLDIASRSEIPAASDATNDVWATSSITGGTFSTNMSGVIGSVPHILPAYCEIVRNSDGLYDVILKAETVIVDGVTHHLVPTGTPTAATCTQEGSTGPRKCVDQHEAGVACPYTDEGASIPKIAHNEVSDPAVAPTCTTAGLTEGSHCSVCNNAILAQEEVPALGHEAGDWTQTKAPTETEAGKEVKKCTVCDEVVEERDIPALGSQTEPATTPATTPTTPATTPATTAPTNTDDTGCKSVVGSAAGMILIALLGGCVLCRKKED